MVIAWETKYIKDIISKIKRKFKTSNCRPIKYILGINVKKQIIFLYKNFIWGGMITI